VASAERLAADEGVLLLSFEKGQRSLRRRFDQPDIAIGAYAMRQA
jgi:hypothetical protein